MDDETEQQRNSFAACAGLSRANAYIPPNCLSTEERSQYCTNQPPPDVCPHAKSQPEDLEHLDEFSRTRVKSALYSSLPGAQRPEGVVEVLNSAPETSPPKTRTSWKKHASWQAAH